MRGRLVGTALAVLAATTVTGCASHPHADLEAFCSAVVHMDKTKDHDEQGRYLHQAAEVAPYPVRADTRLLDADWDKDGALMGAAEVDRNTTATGGFLKFVQANCNPKAWQGG